MKQLIKNHGPKMFLGGFFLGVLMFAVVAFNTGRNQDKPPREIVLLATDVAFHLTGETARPNPTLTLKKGAPVKLVIRNTDPEKLLHCFTIGGLNVKTTGSLAGGASETLLFTPKERGTFVYACLLHPSMSGKLVVE